MTDEYIKLASYYMIFYDETGGCSVKFYEKNGELIKKFYYSWDECLNKLLFKQLLDNKLDPNHKNKLRPAIIKIYRSNNGRTIGFYDKNDNLVFYCLYDEDGTIDAILSSDKLVNSPIDFKYLKDTKNVIIQNNYDSYFNICKHTAAKYWNSFTKFL